MPRGEKQEEAPRAAKVVSKRYQNGKEIQAGLKRVPTVLTLVSDSLRTLSLVVETVPPQKCVPALWPGARGECDAPTPLGPAEWQAAAAAEAVPAGRALSFREGPEDPQERWGNRPSPRTGLQRRRGQTLPVLSHLLLPETQLLLHLNKTRL